MGVQFGKTMYEKKVLYQSHRAIYLVYRKLMHNAPYNSTIFYHSSHNNVFFYEYIFKNYLVKIF